MIIQILRGIFGITILLGICYLLSNSKKDIDWKLAGRALLFQVILALAILKLPGVEAVFSFLSKAFVKVVSFSQYGVKFLFQSFGTGEIESPLLNFAITVLPTIIFFSSLSSLLYYWGFLQKVVQGMAWVMRKLLKLSGAESLSAAGNIFLGQTESPLLVKPYLKTMSNSELFCVMTGGMATIAGGVLAAYVGFLGEGDKAQEILFAKHLLAASLMSAPAAILVSKIIFPQTEKVSDSVEVHSENLGSNTLEAITNGATVGLKLAANIAAMLLVYIALMALANYLLGDVLGRYTGINSLIGDKLTFQWVLGYLCSPIMWLIGVDSVDMLALGQLLGEKTILNEFVAYVTLGNMKAQGVLVNQRSVIIATYMLCGFANFSSIGIQIGGIGNLEPSRKSDLAKYALKAMIAGNLACLFTATLAGILVD